MEVTELMADCDFIMMASSHVYNGNRNDCKVLSDAFGRTVVSCRNFAVNSGRLSSLISIVEATFDNNSQVIVVSSDGTPVFRYTKKPVRSGLPIPDKYTIMNNNIGWQADIHLLASRATERAL